MTKLAVPSGMPLALGANRLTLSSFAVLPKPGNDGVTASSSRSEVTVTASATPHTLGAWTEVFAATTEEINVITGRFGGTGANGIDTSSLLSISTGAAGSEASSVVVENLAIGYSSTNDITLPLRISKGSRVSAALQSAVASKAITLTVIPGLLPHAKQAPLKLVTMGANTATSRGVSITGAAVNTKSAWTEIIASTTQPFGALFLRCQGDGDLVFSTGDALIDVGIGSAGSEVVVIPNFFLVHGTSETVSPQHLFGASVLIPTGSRLAVRWARSNTGNSLDAMLVGVPVK